MISINAQLKKDRSPPILMTADKKQQLEKRRYDLEEELNDLLIEVDRIEIRQSFAGKDQARVQRMMIKNLFNLDEMWDSYHEKILDFHEQTDVLDRYTFLSNYYQLAPPFVRIGSQIPDGIKHIYHESRWCFVYGHFSATVSLCRSVIETILKQMKCTRGSTLPQNIDMACTRKLISKQSAWNAKKVVRCANILLHDAVPATRQNAVDALDSTLNFLEDIYL
jgi:hypothetical protein